MLVWSVLIIGRAEIDFISYFCFAATMENRTFITLLTLWPVLEDCNV